MDPLVEEAQEWVNQTYADVNGYQPCIEDGLTGWGTMHSLTMGLQHELGIANLAAAFGPATLAALESYGNIYNSDDNANIKNIVRYALWCKGYPGGYTDGSFDEVGLTTMMLDAGLDPPGASHQPVRPKVFKALLTMDAYVLQSGGRGTVRDIQRWLNERYFDRITYFIGPCDGHFSRDVQKALMKAIQYELGIPEADANGNFGPGTKAGLRQFDSNPLDVGDSSIFAKLFSAACVFNGGSSGAYAPFVDEYSSELASWVGDFQLFSAAGYEVSNLRKGDYGTWAELLVSTGDPDRDVHVCDTATPLTESPGTIDALDQEHYTHVGRYLENHPNYQPGSGYLNKKIQPGELDAIFSAGMRLIPIWQIGGRDAADFTYSMGQDHGRTAHTSAEAYGLPRSSVIYFAVDYDATDAEISSNILPYFNGIYTGLGEMGRRYVPGVYGSRNVCARVSAEAYARYSYVSGMSWGFSGNLGYPLPANWAFNQIKEFDFDIGGGETLGLDNVVKRPSGDNGVGGDAGEAMSELDEVVDYIGNLHQLARDFRGSSEANRLVMEYLRAESYDNPAWRQLVGLLDTEWIAYADGHLGRVAESFVDPFTGTVIKLDHFAATANGYLVDGAGDPGGANQGDFAGWGGDLCSFYGEWLANEDEFASGRAFCRARLAVSEVTSFFSFGDLLEDVDGWFFGTTLRDDPSISFDDLFAFYYKFEAGAERFGHFIQTRHSGSEDEVENAARSILTSLDDPLIVTLRAAVIENASGLGDYVPPEAMPGYKLDSFIDGYVERLQAFG